MQDLESGCEQRRQLHGRTWPRLACVSVNVCVCRKMAAFSFSGIPLAEALEPSFYTWGAMRG